MKSELLHLLEKLKSDHPDFKVLMVFQNGSARVVGNLSQRQFENLDALEAYAWPQEPEQVGAVAPRGPSGNIESSVTLAPSAQDARAASAITSGYAAVKL